MKCEVLKSQKFKKMIVHTNFKQESTKMLVQNNKEDSLDFLPPVKKAFQIFKMLQLVDQKNKLIQQCFVQFHVNVAE